jgi:riboflavin kinase / FMN adenylyltransferase
MLVIRDPSATHLDKDTVVTVGAYDGLHMGHQELVRNLIRRARDTQRLSGMVTFDPHPRTVLNPDKPLICLTTLEDKIALLTEWGLDLLLVMPFTPELRRTSPRDFTWRLRTELRMTELWVGEDFALGLHRQGDVQALTRIGRELGFEVHAVRPVRDGGAVISATQIRSLLFVGDVEEAAQLLGRPYHLRGRLVPLMSEPAEAGVQLSVRMALLVPSPCALPMGGCYAARVVLPEGERRAALTIAPNAPACSELREAVVDLVDGESPTETPAVVQLLAHLGLATDLIKAIEWWNAAEDTGV